MNQRAQHFTLGLQFDQWKLYSLIGRQRLTKGRSLLGVRNGLVDAELGRAQGGCCLTNSVFVEEVLNHT
jgi:hypothetical protein